MVDARISRVALVALIGGPLAMGQPAGQPAAPAVSPPAKKPDAAPASNQPKAVVPDFHQGSEARHNRFNEISKEGKAQLVFLGDSITEGWEGPGKDVWAKMYGSRQAANFGVSGDRTEHVLWRLDHGNFDGLKPKLIVVMIGTNNTGHRQDPPADTAAGVKAILDRLQKKCPEAKILLLGIFPRGETPDDPLRKLNTQANEMIAKFADGKKIIYKDIGTMFMDTKGTLNKDLMPDLVHPNAKGYEVWATVIEDDVAKLMGEKK